MKITPCKVCGNEYGNTLYNVKEMQFGLREDFIYQLCGSCGCMQLQNVPSDLSKYYPSDNYYSFHIDIKPKKSSWKNKIKAAHLIHHKQGVLQKLLTRNFTAPPFFEWLSIPGVRFNDKILDVGTGNGSLLIDIYKYGFTNLVGIDAFIKEGKDYGKIKVHKKNVFQLDDRFDYVMLHHTFEHMDEPLKVLLQLNKLLNNGKYVLIRTPVMGHYGWKTYNTDWVALDAPRHLIIHSVKSMQLLAKEAGFEIKEIIYDDPGAFNIWASEQYQKDIPLHDANRSYNRNPDSGTFTREQMTTFKKLAVKLDATNQGDQASFYLYKL